jgi:translocation and assembly module TamB
MLYGAWRFIHSERFSAFASKKVSTILTKKMGAKLSFSRVDFSMFPPSTIFKNVQLVKNEKDKFNLALSLEEFGVAFKYASFFSSNLEIDELTLKGGVLNLDISNNPNEPDIEWRKINLKNLFLKYSEIYNLSPLKLNLIKIENVVTRVNKVNFQVTNIVLMPHKKNLRLRVDVTNLESAYEIKNFNFSNVDELKVQLEFNKDQLSLENISMRDKLLSLEGEGVISQPKKELKLDSKIQLKSSFDSLKKMYTFKNEDLNNSHGDFELNSKLYGDLFDPDSNVNLKLTNLNTPFVILKNVELGLEKRNKLIWGTRLEAVNNEEKYKLIKPVIFFDMKTLFFVKTRALLEVKNAFTNTFLYAVNDSLDVFKGYLNGKVEVAFDGEKVFFAIGEKAFLKDFKLILPKSKKPLLENAGFSLENTLISLDSKSNIGIDAKISMPDSLLKLNGIIDRKGLNLIIKDSRINLNSLGPISGIKILGSGPTELKVFGPFNDVRFDFNVDWKKFSLIKLNFGDVQSHFSLSLSDVMLSVNDLTGKFNNTKYNAAGWLKFGDKSGLDLKLDFPETKFSDTKQMYDLVFGDLKIPSDLSLNFENHVRVHGDYDLENLLVEGVVKGKELHLLGEEADNVGFSFSLKNKLLNFKNIKIKKNRGEIVGNANISLLSNYTEVEATGSGFKLNDLNIYKKFKLSYDGDLSLEYDGNGTTDTFSSRLKFKLQDPFIGSAPASSSNGLIYLNFDEVIAKLNLLGGKIKMDSIYNYKQNQVNLKSIIDTSDLREVLGAFSSHNLADKNISGNVFAFVNAKFNASSLDISRFNLEVKNFNLKREEVDLKIDPMRNNILVENGIVKHWDILFTDGKDFFKSKGKNINNDKSILCDQEFSIKSNVLELFNSFVEKSRGIIKGNNQIQIDKKINFNNFKLSSNNSSVKIRNVPGLISDLNYDITKNANRFEINKLIGKYGEGEFRANGFVMFENILPTVNIDFKVDRSIIPLFKKSNLAITGNGLLTGSGFPYSLNGKVSFLHGDIIDDPAEITGDGKVVLDDFNKYLPSKNEIANNSYINLNIGFDSANFITVKNNMAEVFFKAQGQVTGSLNSPEINTRAEINPTASKFKFKGHDFLLSQGYVEIHDKGKVRNSELKFVGNTKVNEYDIKLDISGKLDKVNIVFTSEPFKSQEDIVSLLALGVTSDMNRNLDPNERSAITRLGIGTMFLDRLNVNEDLNSTIGVNLSVMPEFQEDETSLISGGKSALGDSTSNKLKSATKIKLSKKLTNKIDVTVSSTVGGSIEQKQEMNVNWNINKNMSLEGVYEVKPSEEESTSTPTSLGADLKFKWPF